VAPSINVTVVKATADDDLIEITTGACGFNGATPKTVKLTRQQYAKVEQLFNDIKTRLDEVETRADAAEIIMEAIIELHKEGFLPKGINCETILSEIFTHQQNDSIPISGKANDVQFFSLPAGIVSYLSGSSEPGTNRWYLFRSLMLIGLAITRVPRTLYSIFPLKYLSFISFGQYIVYPYGERPLRINSYGWVSTPGQSWEGELHGTLFYSEYFTFYSSHIYRVGIEGFRGINIYNRENNTQYFLGECQNIGMYFE
jgi:hypothetical protein